MGRKILERPGNLEENIVEKEERERVRYLIERRGGGAAPK
jgi:hypothetical protein